MTSEQDNPNGDGIPSSNGEGWDWFNNSETDAMKNARAKLEMDQEAIDIAFARMSKSPEGQIVMKTMASWLEAVEDFDPALGFYNGAAFGFWRTGQRHLVKFIKNAISRGEKA